MLRAVLRVESPDAGTVFAALRPETGRELPRTRSSLRDEPGAVVLEVETSDVSAMRAALNSYLECIRITEDIERITR